jgi:polysaccharide export outer membrane protein
LFAKLTLRMNNRIYYILLLIGMLFTSCVPTQDLIYLQKKDGSTDQIVKRVQNKPYKLQVNDVLSISIKAIDPKLVEIFSTDTPGILNTTEQGLYLKGYNIDDHGDIRLPIVGNINVQGLTVDEVREKIENNLLENHFKKEAGIFVSVRLSGFRYTVNGEVQSPGSKIIYKDNLTILEAVANSGDITVTGDRKDVKVIRQYPQGSETFSIDLTDEKAMQSPCYYLQPNDYVYIKPLKQKTWGTGKTGIESLGTIITILSLATTTFLLLK